MGVTGFTRLPLYVTPIPASRAKKAVPLPEREQHVGAMVGFIPSHEQAHWGTRCWRGPTFRQPGGCCRNCMAIQVNKYLADHHRVFNTGNDPDITTALITGLDIDKVN